MVDWCEDLMGVKLKEPIDQINQTIESANKLLDEFEKKLDPDKNNIFWRNMSIHFYINEI